MHMESDTVHWVCPSTYTANADDYVRMSMKDSLNFTLQTLNPQPRIYVTSFPPLYPASINPDPP